MIVNGAGHTEVPLNDTLEVGIQILRFRPPGKRALLKVNIDVIKVAAKFNFETILWFARFLDGISIAEKRW